MREELAAALESSDTPEGPVATEAVAEQTETETVAEAPAVEAQDAPSYWPADERARFAQLPPDTQKYLLERAKEQEADYTRKTMEVAEQRKANEEITKLFEPYKQQLELSGVAPAQIMKQLLAAHRFLETDPANAIKWLAQSYKVNPESLVAPKSEDQAFEDPALKALREQVQRLETQLQGQVQAEQNKSVQAVTNTIKEFADTKNPDGSIKYPHFEKVRDVMGPLVAKGKTLEQAYEIASYTLPETIDRIKDEVAKTAIADAAKKAEEARKQKAKDVKGAAQVIRSRGTASETSTGKDRSIRDELKANLAEAAGRI